MSCGNYIFINGYKYSHYYKFVRPVDGTFGYYDLNLNDMIYCGSILNKLYYNSFENNNKIYHKNDINNDNINQNEINFNENIENINENIEINEKINEKNENFSINKENYKENNENNNEINENNTISSIKTGIQYNYGYDGSSCLSLIGILKTTNYIIIPILTVPYLYNSTSSFPSNSTEQTNESNDLNEINDINNSKTDKNDLKNHKNETKSHKKSINIINSKQLLSNNVILTTLGTKNDPICIKYAIALQNNCEIAILLTFKQTITNNSLKKSQILLLPPNYDSNNKQIQSKQTHNYSWAIKTDKSLNCNEKSMNFSDKTVNLNEKIVNFNEKTEILNEKLLKMNEKSINFTTNNYFINNNNNKQSIIMPDNNKINN